MITLEEAKTLKPGTIIYHQNHQNCDGTPERWKINGRVKTWKKYPYKIVIPVKHGLYDYDYIRQSNLDLICLTEEEALSN